MQRDDAHGEIVKTAALVSGVLHHLKQCVLIRVHPNGLGEISIAIFIVGDKLAEEWQHLERVGVINRLDRVRRFRELEDEEFRPRF